MRFVALASLIAAPVLVIAQETVQMNFYGSSDCTGTIIGSWSRTYEDSTDPDCIYLTDAVYSVDFEFTNSNGNGFGAFYENTDDAMCDPNTGGDPGININTCYAPSANGCYTGNIAGGHGFTFNSFGSASDCVILPPDKRDTGSLVHGGAVLRRTSHA